MPRRDWQRSPLLEVQHPPCPHCGAYNDSLVIETRPRKDGGRQQLRECRTCNDIWRLNILGSTEVDIVQ